MADRPRVQVVLFASRLQRVSLALSARIQCCMAGNAPSSQDPTQRTSVVLFFVMIAVIIGSVALFLIFKPM